MGYIPAIADLLRATHSAPGSPSGVPHSHRYARMMPGPASPKLSASQLALLAELGEERTANVGDVLYRVGDRRYPFIAIIEGEVAIKGKRRSPTR